MIELFLLFIILYIKKKKEKKLIIYILLFGSAFDGSGIKWFATTALGITDTICGLSDALNTVFPLLKFIYTVIIYSVFWYILI